MSKVLTSVYGAMAGIIVPVVYDAVFLKTMQWPTSASLAGAILVGIVLFLLYEMISGSEAIARLSLPLHKIENEWKQTLTHNSDRPTSICTITYTRRGYVYKGYGLNSDGSLGAEWISRSLDYNEQNDEMSFSSDGTLISNGIRIRNCGYIKFYKNGKGQYVYGDGYLVDMAEKVSQTHMKLTRISKTEFDKIASDAFEKRSESKK